MSQNVVGHSGVRIDVKERKALSLNGWLAILLGLASIAYGVWQFVIFVLAVEAEKWNMQSLVQFIVAFIVSMLFFSMIIVVNPGETVVIQFFGKYVGTLRNTGLQGVLPFSTKSRVSVKVRNFETQELKVNDADGNPVNIAAIVVWQVADTAKAIFAVERYWDFIAAQSESALRHVASIHPYDNADAGEESLRGSTDKVAAELAEEVAARVQIAGLEIVEVRISLLAYAQEIAHAMLQRQQASAVIAAREQIVEGAVSMVKSALSRLELDNVVDLDEERKAAMISNLLVVLCGSAQATPVVNAGSLYT